MPYTGYKMISKFMGKEFCESASELRDSFLKCQYDIVILKCSDCYINSRYSSLV